MTVLTLGLDFSKILISGCTWFQSPLGRAKFRNYFKHDPLGMPGKFLPSPSRQNSPMMSLKQGKENKRKEGKYNF